eukprot:CAMPEP_0204522720 /NCGR_PEP_ID=MMETSP0661-20131031/6473_1 /ASSEMBLY_ACC=CAM_ASM_000606 /TAXON_ID=109239 /ORGANISM="Alexandrium margalefi, Strain AMGDE01CS-322" /LENGTH=55 /DNA_ID=CAMNT_0051528399 /DNA_START=106 /DNA_END=271 /DNA_ORIENTATION=-
MESAARSLTSWTLPDAATAAYDEGQRPAETRHTERKGAELQALCGKHGGGRKTLR